MSRGRWNLVGLAVGIGWFVAVAAHIRYADIRAAKLLKNSAFEICDYVSYRLVGYADCWRDLMTLASYLDNAWVNIALLALAPALLLWLAAVAARTIRCVCQTPKSERLGDGAGRGTRRPPLPPHSKRIGPY